MTQVAPTSIQNSLHTHETDAAKGSDGNEFIYKVCQKTPSRPCVRYCSPSALQLRFHKPGYAPYAARRVGMHKVSLEAGRQLRPYIGVSISSDPLGSGALTTSETG